MPESSDRQNIVGPDQFRFFACEVEELLQEEFLHPSSPDPGLFEKSCSETHNNDASECDGLAKSSTEDACSFAFKNAISIKFSEFQKERLRTSLRQNFSLVLQEVDELVDPVFSIIRIQSQLKNSKGLLTSSPSDSAFEGRQSASKLLKTPSSNASDNASCSDSHSNLESTDEAYDEIQLLVDNDSSQVEAALRKYSDELLETLKCMENNLEGILNTLMSNCRHMSQAEKYLLRHLIKKLPPENLDRVAEIIQNSKSAGPSGPSTPEEVFVDLEKEDNAVLWRVYFYVQAVDRAKRNSI